MLENKIRLKDDYELHQRIRQLRNEKHLTQQQVADQLGVDKTTYAHYEAGRRTPDMEKIRKLGKIFEEEHELLGAVLPIKVCAEYPDDMLDSLEKAIQDCPTHTGNYEADKREYMKLKNLLAPIWEIRDAALDLPSIDLSNVSSGTTIKVVTLDLRAEKLITLCMQKQNEIMGWDIR